MASDLLDVTFIVRDLGEIPQAMGCHGKGPFIWRSDCETNYRTELCFCNQGDFGWHPSEVPKGR